MDGVDTVSAQADCGTAGLGYKFDVESGKWDNKALQHR